jgi:hypothetical protein
VGRLQDIAARNERGGYQLKRNWEFTLRSLFLLVIIALLAITKWAIPPPDHRPGIIVVPDKSFRPNSGGTLMMRPSAAAGRHVPVRP